MRRSLVAAPALLAAATLASPGRLDAQAGPPAWLAMRAGTFARVEAAPWYDSDEPEATLTASAKSLERDFSSNASRPEDIVYEPIGIRVRIVRVLGNGRVALVRGVGTNFSAYALRSRLAPEVPAGAHLRVAGGFGGFADFFATLDTPLGSADRVATGSDLVALGNGVARYETDNPDIVRVHVRVLSGELTGHSGWVATPYLGLPADNLPAGAPAADKACACRLIEFDGL